MRKNIFLFLMCALLTAPAASHASVNEELGIEYEPGLTPDEAIARSKSVTKKYDKAKAGLASAIGVNTASSDPEVAKAPESAVTSPASEPAEEPLAVEHATNTKLVMKNGQTMDVVIESKDEKGMWVSMGGPDMRFYVRRDEVKEIVHKTSDERN